MDPVWQKNLEIYKVMSEKEQDDYLTKLNDSLVRLDAKAKEIVIAYIEFLAENSELEDVPHMRTDADRAAAVSQKPISICDNCELRGECSLGFGKHCDKTNA